MKFIHLADVHLDMIFTSLKSNKDLIRKRRLEQKQIFKDSIDLVKQEGAEFLFISGDLFEQKYVEDETISYVISCLSKIPEVHVFIAPGNHDPLIKTSPYVTAAWPENVTIFGSEVGMYSFDEVDIYGFGFDNYEVNSDEISKIEIENKDKMNILVTHGTLDGATNKYQDIKNKDLVKFDYTALGHIHLPKIDDSKIIYPGSLVAGGFDELGEHGLVIGEITKDTCNLKFKNMDYRQFKILEIDVSDCTSTNEVIDKINLEDDIYRIILCGTRNIDIKKVQEYFETSDKYITEVIDNTKMKYNLEEIAKENTLKGLFTKNMLNLLKEEPEREEEIKMAIEKVYQNM